MEPAFIKYYLFYANYDIYTYAVVSVQIVLNIRLHICKYNTKTTLKLPTSATTAANLSKNGKELYKLDVPQI